MAPKLTLTVALSGEGPRTIVLEFARPAVVGRDQSNEICTPRAGISDRHFQFRLDDAHTVWAEDLGTGGGISMGGQRFQRRVVAAGDTIEFGRHSLEILALEDDEATQPCAIHPSPPSTPDDGPRRVLALSWLEPPSTETRWFLLTTTSPVTVGCAPDNALSIETDALSGFHFQITLDAEGDTWIEDQQSPMGTYINGVRMSRSPLRVGDEVAAGRIVFHVLALDTPDGQSPR